MMNTDRAVLCPRNLSDHDLTMKYVKEDRTLYLDNMRRIASSDVNSDMEETEHTRDSRDSEDLKQDSLVSRDKDLSPDTQRDNENAIVEDSRINNSDRSANNSHEDDDRNEVKVRTTAFSVSDILDPNKFVGGCGIQRVWHPWLRDEGVRDYTKSNLEKRSEDSSITGRRQKSAEQLEIHRYLIKLCLCTQYIREFKKPLMYYF